MIRLFSIISFLAILVTFTTAEALDPYIWNANGYIYAPPIPVTTIVMPEPRPVLAPALVDIGLYSLTWYSCSKEQGTEACIVRYGVGRPVEGRTIANNYLPAGMEVYIDNVGWRVVEDTGRLAERHIDIYVEETQQAFANGFREGVKVWTKP